MVADDGEPFGEPFEDAAAVRRDLRGFAVHHALRVNDLHPEHFSDRLVAEADAEHRDLLAGARLDEVRENSGFRRLPRAGRKNERIGAESEHLLRGRAVVADGHHLSPEHLQVLHDVVGEGVVVVEHDELHDFFFPLSFGVVPVRLRARVRGRRVRSPSSWRRLYCTFRGIPYAGRNRARCPLPTEFPCGGRRARSCGW